MRGLYIGRFNPLHNGHVDVIQYIATQDISHLDIIVGSSQYDYKNKSPKAPWNVNPFTFEERKEMIESSIQIAKPYTIHAVPDYHDYPKWFEHVKRVIPSVDCLFTSDPKEKEFFESHGIEVRTFPRKFSYHGGTIRENIANGNLQQECLPQPVYQILQRINAHQRLSDLYARDIEAMMQADLTKEAREFAVEQKKGEPAS